MKTIYLSQYPIVISQPYKDILEKELKEKGCIGLYPAFESEGEAKQSCGDYLIMKIKGNI